jgi:hypothetical protein
LSEADHDVLFLNGSFSLFAVCPATLKSGYLEMVGILKYSSADNILISCSDFFVLLVETSVRQKFRDALELRSTKN